MSCQEKGKRKFQAKISKVITKGVKQATDWINSDKQWWFVLKFCSYKSIFEQVFCHTNLFVLCDSPVCVYLPKMGRGGMRVLTSYTRTRPVVNTFSFQDPVVQNSSALIALCDWNMPNH